MIVPKPHESIVDEEPAYLITAAIVQIDCFPPRRSVFRSEIRPESVQIVARRPQMVIDHVQKQGETLRMRRVDSLSDRPDRHSSDAARISRRRHSPSPGPRKTR